MAGTVIVLREGGPSQWAMERAQDYAKVSSAVRALGVAELAYCLDSARAEGFRAGAAVTRGHRESCTENLLKGYETGKAEERAAVVTYLLRDYDTDDSRDRASEAIQNGEHRKEKE